MLVAGPFLGSAYAKETKKQPDAKWTGLYAGLNFGGGIGRAVTSFLWYPPSRLNPSLATPNKIKPTDNGVFAGGQFGYLWQRDRFVFGGESDLQYSFMSGSGSLTDVIVEPPFAGVTGTLSGRQMNRWFGTTRARVGFALPFKTLVYGTGGMAYADLRDGANLVFPSTGVSYPASVHKWKGGWVVGGGMEYKLKTKWSLRGEYLYYNLGHQHFQTPMNTITGYITKYNMGSDGHLFRVAANYRF